MKWFAAVLLLAIPVLADGLSDLQEAQRKLEELDLDGVEAALSRVIEAEPKLADAFVARALLRENRENLAGAAADALRASELGGDYWKWATTLARAAHDYGRAARAATGAWKKHARVEDLQIAAESHASAGDFRKAAELYGVLTEKGKPDDRADFWMREGNLLSLAGDHKAGLESLDAALKADPQMFRAHQLRGRVNLRMGKTKEGLVEYQTALKMNTNSTSAHLILGLAYYDTGRWQDAVKTLQRAAEWQNAHTYTHLYLFLARCRTGVPANRLRAKRELMGYLEARPKQDDWFARVGGFLVGNLSEEGLLKIAKKGPRDLQREQLCEAWSYIGQLALIAGDSTKAHKCFKRVIETRVGSFMEYGTADMELRRIGKR